MFLKDAFLLFSFAGILINLFIGIFAIARRDVHRPLAFSLASYAILSALSLAAGAAQHLQWMGAFQGTFVDRIPSYFALLQSWLLILLSLGYFRSEKIRLKTWHLTLIPVISLILLDSGVFRLPETWWSNGLSYLPRASATYTLLLLGWAAYVIVAAVLTLHSYHHTQQPLHRNRLKYWMLIFVFLLLSDAITLLGLPLPGGGLRLLTSVAILLVACMHDLPDIRQAFRQLLSYLIITFFSVVLYIIGYLVAMNFLRGMVGNSALLSGALVAVIIAVLFNPLLRLIQVLLSRVLSETNYDSSQAVRGYSLAISNILELDRLASTAVGLIGGTLGVSSGALCLVDRQADSSESLYCLKLVPGTLSSDQEDLNLPLTSPIVRFILGEQRPLNQYDIDLHPQFNAISSEEKVWFKRTGMDVYVPIFSKGEWIGMFFLGPKSSRDRYYDKDLTLLITLAGQTAVALENARLVDRLVRLNRELENASTKLDKTNQELERLDKTKTDFITIAAHELRTPLTLLEGYGNMLGDDPDVKSNPYYQQIAEGIISGTTRLHDIVGSMLDMVMIDTRTLKLDVKPVTVSFILHSLIGSLEDPIQQRNLTIETNNVEQGLSIEADHAALEKAFYHLIVNAVKFTPDGGKIILSAHRLSQRVSPLQIDSVEVIVADTGIGIDPQVQELIFNKFYQTGEVMLHSSSKTNFKGGGPGLGLAIVKGIVDAHQGKIWVESRGYDEKNCPGSEFHIVLPGCQQLEGTIKSVME